MKRATVCVALVIGAWILPSAESATPAMKRAAHAAAMHGQLRQQQAIAQQLAIQRHMQQLNRQWLMQQQSQRSRGQKATASMASQRGNSVTEQMASPATFFARGSTSFSTHGTGRQSTAHGGQFTSPAALA